MKSNIINRQVLAVNKHFRPVHLTTVREAVNAVLAERARFIDETWTLYNMEEWMDLPTSIMKEIDGENTIVQYPIIHGVKQEIRLPEVVVFKKYEKEPDFELRLNTRNLALRDGYTCQYCAKVLHPDEITKDHVIPQSKGGKDTWENLVIACNKCNLKKASKTPKEAGMTLLSKPKKPRWIPLLARIGKDPPELWGNFIKGLDHRPSLLIKERV